MTKRSLLAIAVASLTSQAALAAPFLPMDARGIAMGNTGVASAKLAHAPAYNPALLSTANQEDDFAILFPQIGVSVADEDEFIDTIDELSNGAYADDGFGGQESLIDHFSTITEDLSDNLDSLTTAIDNLNAVIDSGDAAQIRTQSTALQSELGTFTTGTQDLQDTTYDLTSELDKLSGSGIRMNAGLSGAIAIPSKKFGAAVSFGTTINVSGRTIFSKADQALINAYAEGVNEYANLTSDYVDATVTLADSTEAADACITANGAAACSAEILQVSADKDAAEAAQSDVDNYSKTINNDDGTTTDVINVTNGNVNVTEDPQLTSQAQVVAIAIAELGLSLSREFEVAGQTLAVGITPKLQQIVAYDYTGSVDENSDNGFDEDEVTDTEVKFSAFNLDAGVAYQFGSEKQWQAGLVAKNLISKEYETENNLGLNTTINLDTQFRAGISHTTDWTVVAVDLDLMENDPVAYENATQYLSVGAELDVFDTLQLRAGYRTNLAVSDAEVVSLGAGLSPFGAHLDIAFMVNPNNVEKEAGFALETGFYF